MKWKVLVFFLQVPLLNESQVLSIFLTLLLGLNAYFLKQFFDRVKLMDEKIDRILLQEGIVGERAKGIEKRIEHIERKIFKDS